jgi:hypothetical protein
MTETQHRAFDAVKGCIDSVFRIPAENPRRYEVELLLPSLKSDMNTWKALRDVIERLEPFCSGGFYGRGQTFASIIADYAGLSGSQRDELNRYYLQKVKEFEAGLKQPSP